MEEKKFSLNFFKKLFVLNIACLLVLLWALQELQERIIRVEFAKSMKRPPRPAGTAPVESRHKIYVSNLAWKARSNNLKEFFAGSFKPVSARVVFDTPTGRAAGYGFVSFATEEEMEAAISELDGKVAPLALNSLDPPLFFPSNRYVFILMGRKKSFFIDRPTHF